MNGNDRSSRWRQRGASMRFLGRRWQRRADHPVHCCYNGGFVQASPKLYLLLWGPTWSTSAADTAYLERFLGGLGGEPTDDWSTIMEQYGVPGGYVGFDGSALRGVFIDPTTPPHGVTQSQLAAEVDALYASQSWTDPTDTQIVIATQDGTCPSGFYSATCDPSGSYCAWHSYTALQSVPFTNLPYLAAGADGCGEYYVNSSAQGRFDGFSIVEGHEYAETVTDPFITGWMDGGNADGGEIGDKCSWRGLFDLALTTGKFAMQPLWSNRAGSCVRHATVGVPALRNSNRDRRSPAGNGRVQSAGQRWRRDDNQLYGLRLRLD